MSQSETPNPTTPQPEQEPPQPVTNDDPIPPDPLLDPGSFIDPPQQRSDPPLPPPEDENGGDFEPGSVIAAQPISVVAPGESAPRKKRERKSDPEEMSKRPSWLPEDWKMEVKVRTSGSTAGLIDRYYFEPSNGSRFRSKIEVMTFLETGSKSKGKKSKSKVDAATTSESPASQKQNKRKSNSKTDAGPSGSPVSQKQKKSSAKRKKSDAA